MNLEPCYPIDLVQLYNFFDYIELPNPDIYTSLGKGMNISSTKLTEEVVRHCHEKGKIVGVWIDSSLSKENLDLYFRLMDMDVDFFCSDYPLLV